MPNNTYTEIRLQGAPYIIDAMHGKLASIRDNNETKIGFLEQFIGDPARLLSDTESNDHVPLDNTDVMEKRSYVPAWYKARLDSWGTKWDIYDVHIESIDFIPEHAGFESSRVLVCTWHTAWSPCIPALLQMSKKLDVDITAKYIDEGFRYTGQCTIINGDINMHNDYVDQDVYRGMYEIFGEKHFLHFCEIFDAKYLQTLLPIVKTFASKKTLKAFKKMCNNTDK